MLTFQFPWLLDAQIRRDANGLEMPPSAMGIAGERLMKLWQWINQSLNRKMLMIVGSCLLLTSAIFLALFVGIYQNELARGQGLALNQVNRLLKVSLENAMLKRDLDGLRQIVRRLGEQDGIAQVLITNPAGEIRFSSIESKLGQSIVLPRQAPCKGCDPVAAKPVSATRFVKNEKNSEVLRSFNAVVNKAPCEQCHGSIVASPVNGVLVVDHDTVGIRHTALRSALLFAVAGGFVVWLAMAGLWWALRRFVLAPVDGLATVSGEIAGGHLDARVLVNGEDELARLAISFNDMAGNLQRSMDSVKESEEFLQSLIDSSPDGMRVIAEDCTVVNANKAFCEQVILPHEKVVGAPCHVSSHNRTDPCPQTLVTCPLMEIKTQAKPVKTRHCHIRSDGSEALVEVYAAPLEILVKGQTRRYIVEAIRDLGTNAKLSHEHRLSEIGQLAAGVAHEIHNPLASARLSLQSLLRGLSSDTDEYGEARNYLQVMDTEIDKCIEVTQRLLTLSSPPSEIKQLVNIDSVISDVLSLLSYEALRCKVEVATEYSHPGLRVIASEGDLRMMVLNIVQNAFHAMPDGGYLNIRCDISNNRVHLQFSDTGVGIDEENLSRIFHPFFSHRADQQVGTGLGLAICHAIAERHGGEIFVKSQPGKGTTFDIEFPNVDGIEYVAAGVTK